LWAPSPKPVSASSRSAPHSPRIWISDGGWLLRPAGGLAYGTTLGLCPFPRPSRFRNQLTQSSEHRLSARRLSPCQPDRSEGRWAAEGHDTNALIPMERWQAELRQEGHAHAGCNELDQCRETGGAEAREHVLVSHATDAERLLSQTMSLFEQQKPVIANRGNAIDPRTYLRICRGHQEEAIAK